LPEGQRAFEIFYDMKAEWPAESMARRDAASAGGQSMSEMSRTSALVGSAAFFVLAPGTVAGLIPWLTTHWLHGRRRNAWRFNCRRFDHRACRWRC
jgi:hypothetical protein